jgi:hypothetical protein
MDIVTLTSFTSPYPLKQLNSQITVENTVFDPNHQQTVLMSPVEYRHGSYKCGYTADSVALQNLICSNRRVTTAMTFNERQ